MKRTVAPVPAYIEEAGGAALFRRCFYLLMDGFTEESGARVVRLVERARARRPADAAPVWVLANLAPGFIDCYDPAYEQAMLALLKWWRDHPNDLNVASGLAPMVERVAMVRHDGELRREAGRIYERLLALEPYPEHAAGLVRSAADSDEQGDAVRRVARCARPLDTETRIELMATAYAIAGMHRAAIKAVRRLCAMRPDDPTLVAYLAEQLAAAGETTEAAADFEAAIEMISSEDSVEAAALAESWRRRLESIRGGKGVAGP
jgi:tetratricopeptide (TPR) repeat protein